MADLRPIYQVADKMNGLIVQWGKYDRCSAGSSGSIPYNIAFSNTNTYNLQLVGIYESSPINTPLCVKNDYSANKCNWGIRDGTARYIFWYAIGY